MILLAAQLLSAFMGAYCEEIFTEYGANWKENLFYGHFLSLPLFLPLSAVLRQQYAKLTATPPLRLDDILSQPSFASLHLSKATVEAIQPVVENTPQGIVFLTINALTQLACISGVNLLSSRSSAVTVTIVLNIRKLVSFIFSTILFGHQLSAKMIFGSALVFGSGALYGWETSWRLPQQRKKVAEANGSIDKMKR
jgi:solute carrier family 35 (UDP-xylose/UDP-N-acetylglucosamine transporter), member B4